MMSKKQRKIKIEPRIKLNHGIYIKKTNKTKTKRKPALDVCIIQKWSKLQQMLESTDCCRVLTRASLELNSRL